MSCHLLNIKTLYMSRVRSVVKIENNINCNLVSIYI